MIKSLMQVLDTDLPNVETHPHLRSVYQAYKVNHKYLVYLAKCGEWIHLRVRNLIEPRNMPYILLYEIKNAILGEDVEAIQVFPKKENHIDNSDTYHLWVNESEIKQTLPNLKSFYKYENGKEE